MPKRRKVASLCEISASFIEKQISNNLTRHLRGYVDRSLDADNFRRLIKQAIWMFNSSNVPKIMNVLLRDIYVLVLWEIHFDLLDMSRPNDCRNAVMLLENLRIYSNSFEINFSGLVDNFRDTINKVGQVSKLIVTRMAETDPNYDFRYTMISEVYSKMTNLTCLELHNWSETKMIKIIGLSCPNLKYLKIIEQARAMNENNNRNISQVDLISDESIGYLMNCRKLEGIFVTGDLRITPIGYLNLLLTLPELKYLNIDRRSMTELLNAIQFNRFLITNRTFRLREMVCTEVNDINIIPFMFSDLRSVSFDCNYKENINLMALSHLEQLEKLTISESEISCNNLIELLHNVGPKLKELTLRNILNLHFSFLRFIGIRCCNLQDLALIWCEFLDVDAITLDNRFVLFPQLKSLTVDGKVQESYIKFLVAHSYKLSNIIYNDQNCSLSDDTIRWILAQNPMKNLTELTLYDCVKVSRTGVLLVLQNCSNLTKFVGLSTFCSEEDISFLENLIRSKNWILQTDMDIFYPTLFKDKLT